jgi:hypothetical protein
LQEDVLSKKLWVANASLLSSSENSYNI